jgi:hypothetical protein
VARLRRKLVAAEVRAPAPFVECEWLVAAIDASVVERILLVSETTTRPLAGGMLLIDTGAAWVPTWDLDGLMGSEPARGSSWIVVRAPASWPISAFAMRAGRCVCVRSMPPTTQLPPGLIELGDGAFRSAFAASAIPELASYSTGVVLDPWRIVGHDEIARVARELEHA